jgi:hypothetical protein
MSMVCTCGITEERFCRMLKMAIQSCPEALEGKAAVSERPRWTFC